ncbi:short-chain dehydrogenase/reductase SDR [Fibrella aestuarina BUZ 2]|uniref:Short-chain dehydrogenase/reductase SDR n=1 Tax=Fibrella aestuarina BUZ 2 TaxID=1166018 RepID=I0KC50_9BACT|nr:SDR family oxidoreductase [Fibrella aestuarina]CCH01703.1 short-chain dehydrogenase/reductase SDR [Fibrella aestuarina BUZ 2]
MPESFFHQKVVWITGASSGIGEALALELARQGARLVLSARRADELQRVASATGLAPADVLVLPLDITDEASMPSHTQAVLRRFGRIDVLFLNAGISQRSFVSETDLSVYHRLMAVNFFGVVALAKAVLPHFLAQKRGQFVVTSSVSGKIGVKQRSGYCASKHALHGFFDSLRAEVANEGLRVTMICPGYIRTPISASALDASGKAYGRFNKAQAEGMPADDCARRILRAVATGREEANIGGKELLGIYLKRFVPGLLSRILRQRPIEAV